jgi:hypothetical protein
VKAWTAPPRRVNVTCWRAEHCVRSRRVGSIWISLTRSGTRLKVAASLETDQHCLNA